MKRIEPRRHGDTEARSPSREPLRASVSPWLISFFLLLLVLGCRAHDEQVSEERLERIHTKWDEKSLRIEQQPVAVKQGTTPLVHIFSTGGPIRVVDLTAKVQVAAATVPDQTLVRIDDRNGVIAGRITIAPGPLAAGHEYAIYADPTTDNVIRRGVGPPALTR